ncbi:MAG: GtrA family protein [Candidatus Accumulibacter sp.]|uniref:GtrA family protein n=1 Tax=Accumulibacter sp. TaxID=2053492 RepID=UPI0019FC1EBB|nr:GtrA family protein [Accumulibacter sp.]MBE2257771.1 GtrA family protein [Paracoccaceae bacterium]MCB1942847.1 GtrA family protein [Accumulibacter sp.]MCP5249905.1 GtrA family protein [Accumulibacter sp.]
MSQLRIEVTKFTLVGAANFVLTFIIFSVMLKVMAINYLISLAGAWFCGMLFSYVANFVWVFKPEKTIQFRSRFVKFLTTGLLSLILNMLALNYLVEGSHLDPFYVQLLLIPLVVVFNFTATKFWSLR